MAEIHTTEVFVTGTQHKVVCSQGDFELDGIDSYGLAARSGEDHEKKKNPKNPWFVVEE